MTRTSEANRRVVSQVLAVVAAVVLGACEEKSALYCEAHPDDVTNCSGMVPDDKNCVQGAVCVAPAAVCDTETMLCVQCTANDQAACTDGTVCVNHACQRCTEHAQCALSNVCLPDGTCAAAVDVAYVESGATGPSPCTKAAPCGTLAAGLAANRSYVKVNVGTAPVADNNMTMLDGKSATILADRGAKLSRSTDGTILEVRNNNADVKIYDLGFTAATGGDAAISVSNGNPKLTLTHVTINANEGLGITASAGTLTVSQSTIRDNVGGGIAMTSNGKFVIVGNVFFNNGTTSIGGLSMLSMPSAMNRLEFNSFSKNKAPVGLGSAINCNITGFTAKNNILSDNGTVANLEQVGGTCAHEHSFVRPGLVPPGATNSASNPMFVNVETGDLHLQPGSPAAGQADPTSDVGGIAQRDIDGDRRTSPADLGADEIP